MNLFEEQLKYRQEIDDDNFEEAIEGIAGAVMGKRMTRALNDKAIARTAIEEILKYFHIKMRNDALPLRELSLDELLEFRLRPLGVAHRDVTLDKGWYRRAWGPMLGTLRSDGSAVALIPGKFSGYSWLDRTTGKRIRLNRKTAELIDTEAICFYRPMPMRPMKNRDYFKFMMEQLSVSDLVLFFGTLGVTTLVGLLIPMFSKWLMSDVLHSANVRALMALAVFIVCFSLSQMCLSIFQGMVSSRIGIKMDVAVEAAITNRIMNLPVSFFKDYAAGDLTQRAFYAQSVSGLIMDNVATLGVSSIFSLIYIGEIFAFAPGLTLPALIVVAATAAVSLAATFLQMKITEEKLEYISETSGLTYSMITGIQKIKLAGAEKRMFARWAHHYAKEAELEYNPPVFLKLSSTITLAISLIGGIVLYYYALKTGVSVENYYAFNTAYGLVAGAFLGLSGIVSSIAGIRPNLRMAKPILEAEPEVGRGKEQITSLRGGIELEHVSFRYDENMPNVIDDLSLKINPGEYLAVVGATGCGKSTLLRLLLGFEKPQKGGIFYDRRDLSRVDLGSLRRKIGVVMQDGKLFLGDIYSNIVIAAPQLPPSAAWEAAEIAAIADDIRAMPMGMNTVISDGSGGLSGGQRQRLMIARAIAPKPKILMFDEATSALDNITQKKVSDAIDALKCTRIVIAHRLSTIRHADRIIVLDRGHIAESGTYEELIEKNGVFAGLVARQRLDAED